MTQCVEEKATKTLSMRKFCETEGLRRQDVVDWCKERSLPTDQGVNNELATTILRQFKPEEYQQSVALVVAEKTVGQMGRPIEVVSSDRIHVLDEAIAALSPRPVKFVQLDEQSGHNQDQVEQLIAVVSATERQLEERKALVLERHEALEKQRKVVELAKKKLGAAAAQNQRINSLTEKIQQEEAELAQVLAELGLNGLDVTGAV